MIRRPPRSPLFPYAPLSRSAAAGTLTVRPRPPRPREEGRRALALHGPLVVLGLVGACAFAIEGAIENWSALYLQRDLDCKRARDRKSTRLNSSHQIISYAVF